MEHPGASSPSPSMRGRLARSLTCPVMRDFAKNDDHPHPETHSDQAPVAARAEVEAAGSDTMEPQADPRQVAAIEAMLRKQREAM